MTLMTRGVLLWAGALFLSAAAAAGAADLVQVRQDFRSDPGWEGVNNRIETTDPPTIRQDFGWKPGAIGGTVWQTRTPASYAMPFGRPISFKDKFSASGEFAFMPRS